MTWISGLLRDELLLVLECWLRPESGSRAASLFWQQTENLITKRKQSLENKKEKEAFHRCVQTSLHCDNAYPFYTTFIMIFVHSCFALQQSFEDTYTKSASRHFNESRSRSRLCWIRNLSGWNRSRSGSRFQIKIQVFVWQKCKQNYS